MYKSRWQLTRGLLILAVLLLFLPDPSNAAEWTLLENASIGGIYTDNVNLVENDSEFKESELIGVVTPSVLLRGVGRRATVDLVASLIFNTSDDNPILPRYRAFLGTELVKNNLFFDAIAKADQGRIDPFRPAGSPVVNQTGNFTTIYEYTLNPYFVSRLNGFADLRINYRYSDFLFSDDDVDPRNQQTFRANLSTDAGSSKVSWGLDAFSRKTEYEDGTQSNNTRSHFDAVLRFQLDRKWRFAGSMGTESNNFDSEDLDSTSKFRWYLEARWTPNPRNAFTARYGERFFGHYTRLSIFHQARKSRFRLRYRTELRDPSDDLSQRNILPTTDLSGQPVNPFTTGPFVQPNSLVDLTDTGAFIQDRFDAFYILTGKRTTFELVGQYSMQDYLDSTRETTLSRAWIQGRRSLTRNYSLRSRLTWEGTEDKNIDETSEIPDKSETWRFVLALTRPVGRKSSLSLSYSYADRTSDSSGDSYTENRVALFLNTSFQGIPGYRGGFGRGYGGFWF